MELEVRQRNLGLIWYNCIILLFLSRQYIFGVLPWGLSHQFISLRYLKVGRQIAQHIHLRSLIVSQTILSTYLFVFIFLLLFGRLEDLTVPGNVSGVPHPRLLNQILLKLEIIRLMLILLVGIFLRDLLGLVVAVRKALAADEMLV